MSAEWRRQPGWRPQEPSQRSHRCDCPLQSWEGAENGRAGVEGGAEASREVGSASFAAGRELHVYSRGHGDPRRHRQRRGLQARPGESLEEAADPGSAPRPRTPSPTTQS